MQLLGSLIADEAGADATEYALLAALIAVALIVGASALGTRANGVFNHISNQMPAA